MKNNMLTLLMTLTLFSCSQTSNDTESKGVDSFPTVEKTLEQNDSVYEYLNDSDFYQIKTLGRKWFDSWDWDESTLNINDFKGKWKKEINLEWVGYNPNDIYLMKFDTLLIYSQNKFALDLYSYNTLIEIEDTNIYVGFDVDSKIYVVDKEKKIRAEIVHSGSVETVEEGVWLDSKKIVLLGYYTEKINTPFLWVIDVETKQQMVYSSKGTFNQQRANYFLVKYPKTKLRT